LRVSRIRAELQGSSIDGRLIGQTSPHLHTLRQDGSVVVSTLFVITAMLC
jgi:hypothetical protein